MIHGARNGRPGWARHGTALVFGLGLGLGSWGVRTGAQTMPEAYRLVPGDAVSVTILGDGEGWQTRIDLDGALRLPALGRIPAEGLTLDEAESAITAAIAETDLYVSAQVSLSVVTYAPILVSGAVRSPGQFDYSPALTARAAAGLAGGVSLGGDDSTSMNLQASDIAGQLRNVEIEILSSTLRLARIEAQLEDRTELTFDADENLSYGYLSGDLVTNLLSRERAVLTEEREATEELRQLRQVELQNVERQIELLVERSKVQADLVRLQEEERAASEELDARGLRTRMDMARVERMDASLTAQVLDIEAALSQARTRRADIASSIAQARTDRRLRLLEQAAKLRAMLEGQRQDRRTVLEKSFILGNSLAVAVADDAGPSISYTIRRRRGSRIETITAGAEDQLLPGDALEVDVSVEEPLEIVGSGDTGAGAGTN